MTARMIGFVFAFWTLSSVGAQIAVPEAATPVEKTAARELAAALERVTGVIHEVRPESAASADYYVGATKRAAKLAGASGWGQPAHDEIRRGTVDGGVVLDGHPVRGVLYSVDAFLEDVVGVRWWNSGESDYPAKPNWRPDAQAAYRHAPPFRFRETFYRATLTDADFKVRAKVNTTSYTRYIIPPAEEKFIPAEKGGNHKLVFFRGRRSAYHSFFEVLPPAKYAKAHPDWYSEIGGKRIGGGQLCVTNPGMLEEYVKNTLELLRANRDCSAIQVSQNDEGEKTVCRCATCVAAMEAEGSWSGPYLTFANRVAAAIEKEFPDVTVDTFAYQFTRKAPKTVRPRRNVLVRLCDIECAFNRPLADPTYAENRAFLADLREWSRVAAGNLYLWDYQADFSSYMMPHPNLHVLSDNLRLFRDAGAVGLFEQGDAMCPAGDFAALKCYVTSHLMWDPSKDWRKLTDDFLQGYYGTAAAPHLKEVLRLASESASRPGVGAMGCYHSDPFPWITPEAGRRALAEMDEAVRAASTQSEVFLRRVKLVKLGWDHARIRAWKLWKQEGSPTEAIGEFKRTIGDFGIDAYRETTTRQTLVDYLSGTLEKSVAAFASDDRPIGVFDSGIGGMTVLEKLMAHPGLCGERFTYLGDQANMPYGNYDAAGKSAYLRELAVKDALFLISDGYFASGAESLPSGRKAPAKIVVIACNTATAYGRDAADAVFKCVGARQKVIGVINAGVRSTLRTLGVERSEAPVAIGVLATPGTIASGAYPRTVAAECATRGVKAKVTVHSQGCPGLADAIELGTADAEKIARDNLLALVSRYRASGDRAPLKAVILGCTHYPFLMSVLEKTRRELGMDFVFVDPAVDTAEECYRALKGDGMLAGGPKDRPARVDAYVSVPSKDLPKDCIAEDGTLSHAYKYGRDPGRDEVTTKFVPLRNGTVDRASLNRLVNLLPLTRAALGM